MSSDFKDWNETDVREGIIAPFLADLGYERGTQNDLSRETVLQYPHDFIGRKKRGRDKPIRGNADYILTVAIGDVKLRWVLEAKAPDESLDKDSIEQAYTYARHPEIGAVLYCLCNGRTFTVWETLRAPHESPPLFIARWPHWPKEKALRDIIAPNALRIRFRDIASLAGMPLGAGLGSIETVKSGYIRYHTVHPINQSLIGVNFPIIRGVLDRSADGFLRMHVWLGHPYHEQQEQFERLGLNDNLLRSDDTRLSEDSLHPTVFRGGRQLRFPAGETVGDKLSGKFRALTEDVIGSNEIKVTGHLSDGTVLGRFEVRSLIPSRNFDFVSVADFRIDLR